MFNMLLQILATFREVMIIILVFQVTSLIKMLNEF